MFMSALFSWSTLAYNYLQFMVAIPVQCYPYTNLQAVQLAQEPRYPFQRKVAASQAGY